MSALDFAARGMIAQARQTGRRLATIDMLSRSIAENLPRGLPGVIAAPIAESLNTATQIASGTFYSISGNVPASNFASHYSMYGGLWRAVGTNTAFAAYNTHTGNGSDPTANYIGNQSGRVRFCTDADRFEIYTINGNVFRLLVNGKYVKAGNYANPAVNGQPITQHYFLFDFAGTEFAGNGLKFVEVETDFQARFGGVRVPMGRTVAPWPQPYPLKCALHGDSMVTTLSDSGDGSASLRPRMPQIVQKLTGIADIWANNIGGVGFIADNSGTRSNFIEQAGVDFAGAGFDVVWELGGRNDVAFHGSAAAYQAVIEEWIAIVLADNPDAVILLTGPLTVQNSEAYQSSPAYAAIQNGKKAAAASYPQNCAFIETAGNAVTNNPWIFGTGKQGATTGNGTADLVRGPDGVHLTIYGHEYIATRLVAESARVLPMLASRVRDGVIAGVNNLDLS